MIAVNKGLRKRFVAQEDGQDKLEGRQHEVGWNSRNDRGARWGLGQSWKAQGSMGKSNAELLAEHQVHTSNNIFFFFAVTL